jgi:RHS repeat-associated protein
MDDQPAKDAPVFYACVDPQGTDTNPWRYSSLYFDAETGTYMTPARHYQPKTGRWTSPDPHWNPTNMIYGDNPRAIGQRQDPLGLNIYTYAPDITAIMQSSNLYVYGGNNPLMWIDPTGEAWWHWALGAVIVVAAAAAVVVTAGGAAPAIMAVASVAGGTAAATTGATIAAGAFIGSSVVYGGFVFNAASTSNSVKDFNAQGNWGIVAGTAGGLVVGGAIGYGMSSSQIAKEACFVEGTKIATESGYKAIEEIQAGDFVYSENPDTGEKGLKEVVQVFVRETNELVYLHVDGREIITTPEHPFYVSQKGWTSAIQLRAGDKLVLRSGEIVIIEQTQHEVLENPIPVYNFEVADWHTYYVTESDVLVHNACGMDNLRTLQNTTIKGYNVSMDLERGGSGLVNIHVKVDNVKYFFDGVSKFFDANGKELPNSLRNNADITKALDKALDALTRGW